MRLLILGVLVILTTHFSFGQETKKVNKNPKGFREEFSVLTSDKKVKHGPYKKYKGDQLVMEGTFDKNVKVGEWKFYSKNELDQVYDFSSKELKFIKKVEYQFKTEVNGVIEETLLDTPPSYVGSKATLQEELDKVTNYPVSALRMAIEGKVLIHFWISENNELLDPLITRGISSDCDREVFNALKKIEQNWIAATKNGKKVKAELFIAIEYQLEGKTITVL